MMSIGYERAAALAKASLSSGRTLSDLVVEAGVMSEAEYSALVIAICRPGALTQKGA